MHPLLSLLLLVAGLFMLAVLSSYLTWGPLTSTAMVQVFGPALKAETAKHLTAERALERRRQIGMTSEIVRAAVLAAFSYTALAFYIVGAPLAQILAHPHLHLGMIGVAAVAGLWCVYLGPRSFAIRHCGHFRPFNRRHFRDYVLPYLVWIPHPVAIWGGIGLVTLTAILLNIGLDLATLASAITRYQQAATGTVAQLQIVAIQVVEFGARVSAMSQKYVVTTLLLFAYVFLEQRSTMRETILESSVDRLKTGVWLGLLFTVGFSLVWMPWNFDQLHLGLRDRVSAFALTAASAAEAADLIALQGYLEDHDLRWVMLSILTGYGNMVSLAAAASAVVLWRVYFGAAPIRTLLRIFLPRYAIGLGKWFVERFQLDLDVQRDDTGPKETRPGKH
ncbi:MAG TPA: hypothetical protein PK954_04890 [Anaerolineales bacterium]|nr:hypothetical protein [Anaerolineales bacterium]HRF48816.1 hypothetical protein [Anaerolineales bacterium]